MDNMMLGVINRRDRRLVIMTKVLKLMAIAIIANQSSAFAPPPQLNSLSTAINLPAQCCDHRNYVAITSTPNNKQRRRKYYQYMSPIEDDDSIRDGTSKQQIVNENETTETTQKNNTLDEFGNVRPKQTTIPGDTSLIFEMARRMLVWDDELYESGILNDASSGSSSGSAARDEQRSSEGGGGGMSPTPPSLLSLPSEKLNTLSSTATTKLKQSSMNNALPRWRPSAIRQQTISNVNPNFRSSSPVMTNAGYASILRRNSRKKNKPSMWKHCLRTYNKMAELEKQGVSSLSSRNSNDGGNRGGGIPGVGYTDNLSSSASSAYILPPQGTRKKRQIKRTTAHHEAALVAASKLGEWELAVSIFRQVESSLATSNNNTTTISAAAASSSNNNTSRKGMNNGVTDNMILSVITACVKGSKVKRTLSSIPPPVGNADTGSNPSNATEGDMINVTSPLPPRPMLRELTVGERRRPLDIARDIILSMENNHDIPLVARHINPLASAYNRLGLRSEATILINEHLKDRVAPPPPPKNHRKKPNHNWKAKRDLVSDNQYQDKGFEAVRMVEFRNDDLEDEEDDNVGYEESQLNIHQMKSKDRASYSLLVQGAAMDGDWVSAVEELQRMTEAGLHPNTRNLNSWNEVMERGCRPTGNGEKDNISTSASYGKKKRDVMWLGNLR